MVKNYILTSFRNIRKHFSYALINIFGLGLGLATCLLLVTWIRHEMSYDRFHSKGDRIYRASLEYSGGGQVAKTSVSPTALLPAMLTLPETETGVRVFNPSGWSPYLVKYGETVFQENHFYVADSTFFNVFDYQLLQGDPAKALKEPYSLVMTKSMAQKYFGDEDPIGKTLQVNTKLEYLVTGVMSDPPSNSLMRFDCVGSFNSLPAGRQEPIWWSANYQTFVVLKENASLQSLKEKTNDIVTKAVGSASGGDGSYVRYNFTPLTDIYLKSDVDEPEVVSDIKYIYIFSAVALLVLIIACINYINLATARAADRAKEVGIRKVVGALRNQLFIQFISESTIITLFAFVFAFLLAQTLLPFFNELTGKTFHAGLMLQPSFILFSLGALLIISLLSGAYPALAITAFKPVSILKGNFRSSTKGIWLRKTLVVVQFAISVILITGTLIIIKQLNFIQDKKLGYDRENTMILPLDTKTREVYEALKTELVRSESATHVGRGSESPTNIQGGYSIRLANVEGPGVVTTGLLVDEDYLSALGMEIMKGRDFTNHDIERLNKDTVYSFILNESALAALYVEAEDAIGKKVVVGERKGEIVGVVKNFHFASLHSSITPLVIFPEDQFSKIFIKLPSGNTVEHVTAVQKIYKSLVLHRPFEFQFLDQQYQALYTGEQRMGSVFVVFAALAIIIACLGLLGLVAFSAAQKTKEIGIRKVMGATAANIVMLITKDFTKLVVLAIVIGVPVAYWIMSQWLEGFVYKTEIGMWPVAIASVICILIALTTAGYQAVKAALIDPARTLRNE